MYLAMVEGISMGLVLSMMIGPVFFALIQNSLEFGFRNSVALAFGILVSDLLYVLLTYFSVSLLSVNPSFEILLGYLGGLVLIGFGISSFLKKAVQRPNSGGLPVFKQSKRKGFLKGFSINGINPFVLLFWISIAGLVNLKNQFDSWDIFVYYSGILLTVFSTDLLKAFVAKQLSRFVTPRLLFILNKAVGFALLFFGARLIWFAWEKQAVW